MATIPQNLSINWIANPKFLATIKDPYSQKRMYIKGEVFPATEKLPKFVKVVDLDSKMAVQIYADPSVSDIEMIQRAALAVVNPPLVLITTTQCS